MIDLTKFTYYVIYTVESDVIKPYQPPCRMRITERDYDTYYFNKQRKYVGELTYKQFEKLVDKVDLWMDSTKTMGSLTEFGHIPAHSFNSNDRDALLDAYVTPITNFDLPNDGQDELWEEIKQLMLKKWGY